MTISENNKDFAIVFPGQGSQHLGMLSELALEYPVIRDIFAQASNVLAYDLWDLTQNGPEDKLNQTEYTQPALLAASYAIWHLFTNKTNRLPTLLAGHSLGEYSALVAANSINFLDAVKLVAARGKFMQEAVPVGSGSMAAVLGLDLEQIHAILNSLDSEYKVEIANLNAIGQTVIAGEREGVIVAIDKLKSGGAKLVMPLDVSVPSHCSLMQPAAQQLKKLLDTINISAPTIKVIHNYSLDSYSSPEDIRQALSMQLTSPVRWVETIQSIAKANISLIYEFGPGAVLSKLCKRIDKTIISEAINSSETLAKIINV
jgi:[acyl-carrier-protein] S-malonyltransferase